MDPIIDWLLTGDVSIQYQTKKYLLGAPEPELAGLRSRIAAEGFGKAFLGARNLTGHWGERFYQPKWISSHYTLLDLRHLEIEPVPPIVETLRLILDTCKAADGSINCGPTVGGGDICVNGMFLNYASFFRMPEADLKSIVDYLLSVVMPDGGFNCDIYKKHPVHSSVHTTLSVLEGIHEFLKAGYAYRAGELRPAMRDAEEFLLRHRLYKSDKSGEVIDRKWTMLSFPPRWKYDILRALVFFADAGLPYDSRMDDALALLISKRRSDGTWPVQDKHAGQVHFDMEKTGGPSRFNTLRALRVLNAYGAAQE